MRRPEAGRTVLCLVASLVIGACSGMSIDLDKRIDYKTQGEQLPPLEVPPDLTKPGADERYAVPNVNARGTATYSEYSRDRTTQRGAATGSNAVLPQLDNARIQRDGNQRWLLVKGTPEQVWRTVKDFWQEAGFIVNVEIPAAGIMETDWAENRARVDAGTIRNFFSRVLDTLYSSAERDKFRVRIERGAEPGVTEIFISHRGMEEVYLQASGDQINTRWQPRPPDPLIEAQMLGRLMLRFGADPQRAQAQLSAPAAIPPRATLVKGDNGERTLTLEDQFDRAWRRVGLALDRVGFTVEDRDRSHGLYYVRYIDPQIDNATAEKPGLLSRLKFWGDDKPKLDQFRIQIKDDAKNGSNVNVLTKDGKQETSDTAGRILTLLYDQLK